MLRITVQNTSGAPTVHLDGKLAGEWVKELEHVWDGLSIGGQATHTTLDLSGVSFVDADGKRLLGAILQQGAKLEEPQPLVQFILNEMDTAAASSAVPIARINERKGVRDEFPRSIGSQPE